MFSPNSLAAINNCKIRLSLRKRQLLSQNPFKVNARKIFGKFNPLVSTFVSQHTILQRIELGSCEVRARVEHSSLQRSESRSEIMMLIRQLSYAIKNQLKAPKAPTRGISFLSLVLYGISQDPCYLSLCHKDTAQGT